MSVLENFVVGGAIVGEMGVVMLVRRINLWLC